MKNNPFFYPQVHVYKESPIFYPPGAQVLLPLVGPFQTMTRPDATTLPNVSYQFNTELSGAGTTDDNPLKANNVTLASSIFVKSSTYSLFLWGNKLTFGAGSTITTFGLNGQNAGEGACCSPIHPGAGGDGASGGGGGSQEDSCIVWAGGAGGDGNNGSAGSTDGGPGAAGGVGYGRTAISRYPTLTVGTFNYGIGGNAGCFSPSGPWGGGGAGGGTGCNPLPFASAGGGGGAGPIVLVFREITGPGVATGAGVSASGGAPGGIDGGCAPTNDAQSGGNANIHVFAQKFTADCIGGFAFNTLKLYEVASDGVTILNTFTNDFAHGWNHL